MTDDRSSERASYDEARSAFEKLETKDKVAFVLEATFGMLGRAAEEGGRALADVLNDLASEAKRHGEEAADEPATGDGSPAGEAGRGDVPPPPSPS